jgi:acid phosphatase family membrane protein YuiD
MNGFNALMHNISFWCAFTGWALAQGIKFVRHYARTRQIDFSYFVRTGGMPSSHSALVCALASSVGLESGFDSPLFATTLVVAAVVMFDAQSFRRAAGLQARVLNQMVEELFKEHHLSQGKLVEFLGHTRTEVFSGMALGVMVTAVLHLLA